MDKFTNFCQSKGVLITVFSEQGYAVITYKKRKARFKTHYDLIDKYQILKDLLILSTITEYGTVSDLKGFVKFAEDFGVLYPASFAQWKQAQQDDKNAPSPLMGALTTWQRRHGDAHLLHALLQEDYQEFDQIKYL